MRKALLILPVLLAGCGLTPQGDAVRSGIATKGAELADNALENAEWVVCFAASIGSVKRRYGVTPERAKEYSNFCPTPTSGDIGTLLGAE